jgi:hypothetical protein
MRWNGTKEALFLREAKDLYTLLGAQILRLKAMITLHGN